MLSNLGSISPPLERGPPSHVLGETHRHLLTALLGSDTATQLVTSDSRDNVIKPDPTSSSSSAVAHTLIISHNPADSPLTVVTRSVESSSSGAAIQFPSQSLSVLSSPICVNTESYPTSDIRPTSASQLLQSSASTNNSLSPIKSFSQPQSPEFRSRRGSFPLSPCRLPMKKRKLDWGQLMQQGGEDPVQPASAPYSSVGFSFSSNDLQLGGGSCKPSLPECRELNSSTSSPILEVGNVPTYHPDGDQSCRPLEFDNLPNGYKSNNCATISSSEALFCNTTNGYSKLSSVSTSDNSVLRDTLKNLVNSSDGLSKSQQSTTATPKRSSGHSNVTVLVRTINAADKPSPPPSFHRYDSSSADPLPTRRSTLTTTLASPQLPETINRMAGQTCSSNHIAGDVLRRTTTIHLPENVNLFNATTAHHRAVTLPYGGHRLFQGCRTTTPSKTFYLDKPNDLAEPTTTNYGGRNIPNSSHDGNMPLDRVFTIDSSCVDGGGGGRLVSTLATASSGVRCSGPKHNNWLEPKTSSLLFSGKEKPHLQRQTNGVNHLRSQSFTDVEPRTKSSLPKPDYSLSKPVAHDVNDAAQILMFLSPSSIIDRSRSLVGNNDISDGLSISVKPHEELHSMAKYGSRMPLLLVSASSSAGAEALAAAAAIASGAPASSLVPVPVQITTYNPSYPSGKDAAPGDIHTNGHPLLISIGSSSNNSTSKDKILPISFLFNGSSASTSSSLGLIGHHNGISVTPNTSAKMSVNPTA